MEQREGSCCLLRPLPSRPTQRVCKISKELDDAATVHDLKCFASDTARQQLDTFHETWSGLQQAIKDLEVDTMTGVLNQLQQWSGLQADHLGGSQLAQKHGEPSRMNSAVMHDELEGLAGLLPTVALSLASCTNTAGAYACLLCHLKQQGHPTALISARETEAGVATVINGAMRQYLGTPSAADDVPALLAWWKDECQRSRRTDGGCAAGSPAAKSVAEDPMGKGQQHMALQGTSAPADKRELRARITTPAGKSSVEGGRTAAALQVPLLVLQDADGLDPGALEDLVVALQEVNDHEHWWFVALLTVLLDWVVVGDLHGQQARHAGLPLVLILGITSSHHGMLQLLPNSILRRTQLLQLSLPPARQQVSRFFRVVLLSGPQPRVVLGPRCAGWLSLHFKDIDASASMAHQAMQLAYVQHFLQQPLSCLAAAAASGSRRKLRLAIQRLSCEQFHSCLAALSSSISQPAASITQASRSNTLSGTAAGGCIPSASSNAALVGTGRFGLSAQQQAAQAHLQSALNGNCSGDAKAAAAAVLEGSICGAVGAFQLWRLGLLVLSIVAKFTGASEVDGTFQLPSLYAAAQQPSFLSISRRGALSACGRLLLKLLGSSRCSAPGSSGSSHAWPSRAGVVPVCQLKESECVELVAKLLQLLEATLQGCTAVESTPAGRSLQASGNRQTHDHSNNSSSDGSDSDESSSESGTDDAVSQANGVPSTTACRECSPLLSTNMLLQQLRQALQVLHTSAGGAAAAPDSDQMLQSPDQADGSSMSAEAFQNSFADLLTGLPEQLEATPQPAADAAPAPADTNDPEVMDPAAFGITSTPTATRGAGRRAGTSGTPLPTPGALASALCKQVRFAPDTPDHARAKAAGAGSAAKSTPDDEAAPGLIKTPKRRNGASSTKKPRKKLFGAQAAAAAEAVAAKARKPKGRKQDAAVGDIAGSDAAKLAAVAAGDAAAAQGNKRHARLAGLFANTTGTAAGQDTHEMSVAARTNSKRQPTRSLLSPTTDSPAHGDTGPQCLNAASGSPDCKADCALSAARPGRSRLHNSSTSISPQQGLAGVPIARDGTPASSPHEKEAPCGGNNSSRVRSSSRLSRHSAAATLTAAAPADGAAFSANQQAEAAPMQLQGQQQPGSSSVAADARPAAVTWPQVTAWLLEAVIPKMLHNWVMLAAAQSSTCKSLPISAIQQPPNSQCNSSDEPSVDAFSAGLSLAAAGAAAFCFDDVQVLHHHLTPAPSAAVHSALVAPALRLQRHPVQVGCHGWEDTCLAYVLLQQQHDNGLAVSDWFGLFCEALKLKGFDQQQGPEPGMDAEMADADVDAGAGAVVGHAAGRAVRARARVGRKARVYAEARAAGGGSPAAKNDASNKQTPRRSTRQHSLAIEGQAIAADSSKAGRKRGSCEAADAGRVQGAAGITRDQQQAGVDEQELLAAAARFSQAAAELQLLGVWKGTKRRKAAGVLRMFAPEGPALCTMAAAAALMASGEEVDG